MEFYKRSVAAAGVCLKLIFTVYHLCQAEIDFTKYSLVFYESFNARDDG